ARRNIWLAMMYQAAIAKVDRKTHELSVFPFPKEWISTSAQASMVSPTYSNVDGKVWTNNQEDHLNYRLDLATGKFENPGPAKTPAGKQIRAYGMPTDHQNNLYQLEFGGGSIGRRDAKALEGHNWPTPGGAAASTSKTGCGLPNMAATASACSTRRPTPSRSGGCRRLGARPTTSLPSRTAPRCGPARC